MCSKCSDLDTSKTNHDAAGGDYSTQPNSSSTHQNGTVNSNHHTYNKSSIELEPLRLVWRNVLIFVFLHIGAVAGLYQLFFVATWQTLLFTYILYVFGGLGITAGAHRLWAHKSYKARVPLRIFLMIAQTMALQNDVIEWCRDHRGHHKWSDTNADPHNSNRGFFFSHMGWLVHRKHPDVIQKGRTLDMNDLTSDPVLRFQRKFYKPFAIFVCFVVPSVLPWYFWQESPVVAYCTSGLLRYTITLHCTWMVNSVAHRFGNKPYDKHIEPAQSVLTSLAALGEGWHNYHHAFPQDYKTAEMPYTINFTTFFIDCCALLGLAYDRKTTSHKMIQAKAERTGDGSWKSNAEKVD